MTIIIISVSCAQISNNSSNSRSCTADELAIIQSGLNDDYKSVREYLENGGNPMLECQAANTSPSRYYTNRLSTSILLSGDSELIKYFLELDITQGIKDEYFVQFVLERNSEMVKFLIGLNAQFSTTMICCSDCLDDFEYAISNGYDINVQNPENGFSLFLEYAGCPSEKTEKANIEVMKYLIDQGADIHQVTKKGQTALDLAVNDAIIAFLKPLFE